MSAYAVSSGGQNHDRLSAVGDAPPLGRTTMQSTQDDGPDDVVEITASQKMISAISGSLLTSLLGELVRRSADGSSLGLGKHEQRS